MTDRIHPACVPTADGRCSLCGDEATVARVASIDPRSWTAEVLAGSERRVVALDLLDEVATGDDVLVHMGFAITRVRRGAHE